MSESRNKQQQLEHSGNRGTYAPPMLKEFGQVGALTQNGTGRRTEIMIFMMSFGMMRML